MAKRYTSMDLLTMGFSEEDGKFIVPKKRGGVSGKPRKKQSKKEENMQMAVSTFIKEKYPDVIFVSDMAAGMRLPIFLAARAKKLRSSRGLPDVIILEPSRNGKYRGLCLELKSDGASPFLKDGSLSSDKHVQEQGAILERLNKKGYYATFCVGVSQTVEIINWYMGSDINNSGVDKNIGG